MTTTPAETGDAPPAQPIAPQPVAYGARAARGSLVNVSVQLAAAGISYVANLVLAWFLDPAHFGLLALANSWIVVAAVFRDAGASRILIQRQNEFHAIAGTVSWLALIASGTCALLTVAVTPVLAHVYENPQLTPVLLVSALRLPLGAMGAVSAAKLTIDMRWRAQGVVQLMTVLASSIASVAMATQGWGVYSLVVPQTLAEGVRALWLWRLAGLRATQRYSKSVAKLILGSSGYVMASGLLVALRGQGDYITLGIITSSAETGRYFMAFSTAVIGTRLLMGGLVPVLFSVSAKITGERERQEAMVRRVFHTVAAVLVLTTALQASLSWPFFRLVMAPKWAGVATLFSILSIVHLLISLNSVIVQPVQAEGRFRSVFLFDLAFAPFELGMFVAGALIAGALGVAIFAVASALTGFLLWYTFCCRLLGFSLGALLVPLWRPLVAAIPVVTIAVAAGEVLPPGPKGDVVRMVIVITHGSAAYLLLLWLLWHSVLQDAVNLLRKVVGRSQVA